MENKKKYLLFANGGKAEVMGETSKYWLCEKTQYRKHNPQIVKVFTETVKKEKKNDKEKKTDRGDE